jgi:hypothetical protein
MRLDRIAGRGGTDNVRTSRHVHAVSVIPLKADIDQRGLHVR